MNQNKRLRAILKHLEEHEQITVEQAVALYAASRPTVRRDFHALAADGLARRIRGGLRRLPTSGGEMSPYLLRQELYPAEKAAIAKQAATLLRDGDIIVIDGGTSTFHMAEYLGDYAVRIITNSLRIGAYLAEREPHTLRVLEVILTGGALFPRSFLLVGRQAKANLQHYFADVAFLSAGGVSPAGITNNNEGVVESEQVIIANSKKTVVLADHSKLGKNAMCHVAALDQVDLLITDEHPDSAPVVEELRRLGLDVATVPVAPGN